MRPSIGDFHASAWAEGPLGTRLPTPHNRPHYRRFHHTINPAATTTSGSPIRLEKKIVDIWRLERFNRRSSCSLGRIEIRSSSELSQFIMFKNRSRFPLNRRILLATQFELPTTTKRPSLEPFTVPAAPSGSGPFLSFFGSTRISAELRFVVAKLLSEVENNFSAEPPDFTSTLRASGKAVATSFISRTMAWDS